MTTKPAEAESKPAPSLAPTATNAPDRAEEWRKFTLSQIHAAQAHLAVLGMHLHDRPAEHEAINQAVLRFHKHAHAVIAGLRTYGSVVGCKGSA